jgi:hypothetical protein
VEFLVIGGVAAVLHGAPVATFDLDVVHSRKPDNLVRLRPALEEVDAHCPVPRFCSLNLLGSVGPYSYQDLLAHSTEIEAGEGVRVQVVQLEWIIRLKEEANAEKDRAVLPILRRTLEERSR